jgi:hypothetical protein
MLNPDYHEILSLFFAEKVEYLLVGAYALAAHSNPRATEDIDLWVNPTPENSVRVHAALARFGARVSDLNEHDFSQPEIVLQIGEAPRRIDILTTLTGVDDFDAAFLERLDVEMGGLSIPVLSQRLLIENKRVLGRKQDLTDLRWLENPPNQVY